MEINFLSAFTEEQAARYAELEGPCSLLSQDVYSGPLYVGTSDDGEECTLDGETIYVVGWGEDNSGGFFESSMADKIQKAASDFVEDMPRYYCPDWDGWVNSEPDSGYEDDDGTWVETDEMYYIIDEADWYTFLFSKSTWRDIMR